MSDAAVFHVACARCTALNRVPASRLGDDPTPAFAQAAAELKGRALLVRLNSDENPQTAARFAIRSIPTLVRIERGREVRRISGALPAGQIVALAS